jgi:hypothetical protein
VFFKIDIFCFVYVFYKLSYRDREKIKVTIFVMTLQPYNGHLLISRVLVRDAVKTKHSDSLTDFLKVNAGYDYC